MPGFFEALKNIPEPKKVVPKVTIDGREFEVSTELFKEIQKHGEQEYTVRNDKIVMKRRSQARSKYPVLAKGEKGHDLLDGNIFWPTDKVDGGYEWTR
jgi:hypothetical protein